MVLTFQHGGENYKYRALAWVIPAGTHNTWLPLTVDYITPEVRSAKDNLKVYVWNEHGGPWRVDDLRVDVYERN